LKQTNGAAQAQLGHLRLRAQFPSSPSGRLNVDNVVNNVQYIDFRDPYI
jgi:hypothetical protein